MTFTELTISMLLTLGQATMIPLDSGTVTSTGFHPAVVRKVPVVTTMVCVKGLVSQSYRIFLLFRSSSRLKKNQD